jgi:hypothetical protein
MEKNELGLSLPRELMGDKDEIMSRLIYTEIAIYRKSGLFCGKKYAKEPTKYYHKLASVYEKLNVEDLRLLLSLKHPDSRKTMNKDSIYKHHS